MLVGCGVEGGAYPAGIATLTSRMRLWRIGEWRGVLNSRAIYKREFGDVLIYINV